MADDFTDQQAIDAIKKMAFEYKVFSRAEAVLQRLVDAAKRIEELNVEREAKLERDQTTRRSSSPMPRRRTKDSLMNSKQARTELERAWWRSERKLSSLRKRKS